MEGNLGKEKGGSAKMEGDLGGAGRAVWGRGPLGGGRGAGRPVLGQLLAGPGRARVEGREGACRCCGNVGNVSKLLTFRSKERSRSGVVAKKEEVWAKMGGSGQRMHFVAKC